MLYYYAFIFLCAATFQCSHSVEDKFYHFPDDSTVDHFEDYFTGETNIKATTAVTNCSVKIILFLQKNPKLIICEISKTNLIPRHVLILNPNKMCIYSNRTYWNLTDHIETDDRIQNVISLWNRTDNSCIITLQFFSKKYVSMDFQSHNVYKNESYSKIANLSNQMVISDDIAHSYYTLTTCDSFNSCLLPNKSCNDNMCVLHYVNETLQSKHRLLYKNIANKFTLLQLINFTSDYMHWRAMSWNDTFSGFILDEVLYLFYIHHSQNYVLVCSTDILRKSELNSVDCIRKDINSFLNIYPDLSISTESNDDLCNNPLTNKTSDNFRTTSIVSELNADITTTSTLQPIENLTQTSEQSKTTMRINKTRSVTSPQGLLAPLTNLALLVLITITIFIFNFHKRIHYHCKRYNVTPNEC